MAFGAGRDVDLAEQTVAASLGWHPAPRFGLEASVGALVSGTVTAAGTRYDFEPGFAASLTGSWLALPEAAAGPFVLVAGTASVATARAGDDRFTGVDLRVSVVAGKTFWERLTPYLVARAFAGPVFWRLAGADVTGGDRHHYAVGAGAALRLPAGLDLFVEGAPLGERTLSAGAGKSF